jgi:hypothetical protein
MLVDLPFTYEVKGVPFKSRDSRRIDLHENVSVHIRDVSSADTDLALVISKDGVENERFIGYVGALWVRDARDEIGALPFHRQHIDWVLPQRDALLRAGEGDKIKALCDMLSFTGLFATYMTKFEPYHVDKYGRRTDSGHFGVHEKSVESERIREVSATNREARLERTISSAARMLIAVDGVVHCRAPEPILELALGFYGQQSRKWRFGTLDYSVHDRSSLLQNYPVSLLDVHKVEEWFRSAGVASTGQSEFTFEVMAPGYLGQLPTKQMCLMRDASEAIEQALDKKRDTPFISKWCQVRDLVATFGGDLNGQPPGRYDELSGLMSDLCVLADDRHVKSFGSCVWDSREMTLDLSSDDVNTLAL